MTFWKRVTVLTCLSNWPVGHATNRSPTSSTAPRVGSAADGARVRRGGIKPMVGEAAVPM